MKEEELNEYRPGYSVVPHHVLTCTKCSPGAKVLFGMIVSLAQKEGYCFASNAYLMQLLSAGERSVTRWLTELSKAGYIFFTFTNPKMRIGRKIFLNEALMEAAEASAKSDQTDSQSRPNVRRKRQTAFAEKGGEKNIRLKDKENTKVFSVPTAQARSAPPAEKISFCPIKRQYSGVTAQDISMWKASYGGINIEVEMSKSISWLLANPDKCSKKRNWRRFLTNWLNKASETQINRDMRTTAFQMRSEPIVDRRTKDRYGNPVETPHLDNLF